MARSDIRFLLGFEPISLEGMDPNRTVLDWLRDIAADGEHFETLRQEGIKRISSQIEQLYREIARIDETCRSLLEHVEARIDQLPLTKTPAARQSIETSIARLEKQRADEREKRLYVENEIKHHWKHDNI